MSFFRFDGTIQSAIGNALDGVEIYVCTQPANTGSIPPSPLATIYSNSSGTALANPVVSDGNGNFFFYAASGTYTLVYFDPLQRIPTQIFPDQQVVTTGGGTVTSVGLTMPAEFSVSGSPLVGSGTLAVSKVNQNANRVYAGPSSGGAAAPAFRALVSADLPAGVGSVTSVTLGVSASALFTASVSGTNPVVSSGTFTLNIALANQAANVVLAGPTSGGSGPVSARRIVPADLLAQTAVAFSATPTFDASASGSFTMTLTGNVTSSSVTNPTTGQTVTFILKQDGTGGRTFAWPANFKGASAISTDPNAYSVQSFCYDGSAWHATGPGSTHA